MTATDLNKEIILQFSGGSAQAFEHIYKRYSKIIYKRLLFLLKDPETADEILQSLFIKIWDMRETIDADKPFSAYILRMADHMAIDVFRKLTRDKKLQKELWDNFMDYSTSPDEDYIYKENLNILEQAIEQMPPQRKLIFRLCKIEGRSYKEVSEELNISYSTISNQLVIAMKFLKKYAIEHENTLKSALILMIFKDF